jgi:hypothetical protein
VIDKRKK